MGRKETTHANDYGIASHRRPADSGRRTAQPGIPGSYDPFGSRPGFPVSPGVSEGLHTPYFNGLPPQVNEMLRNQESPGTPFGPGPYVPGGAGEPYVPGVPTIGDPFRGPAGVRFPPGIVAPYDPTERFRNPRGILPPSPAIPDIRNLPQIPPMPVIDPKAFDFKPDFTPPPPTPSLPGGCGDWVGIILGALGAAGAAAGAGGRRSSGDRK